MEIQGEKYRVFYDAATATVKFQGVLRLYGVQGYSEIANLLDEVEKQAPPLITLDVQELEFLNSSGISTLFRFVIAVRNRAASEILALGSQKIVWQEKALSNLQHLMPSLRIEIL
ncbi:MAG: slr1659 superfamily regulator [Candidatus Micrarchaeota archaeon]